VGPRVVVERATSVGYLSLFVCLYVYICLSLLCVWLVHIPISILISPPSGPGQACDSFDWDEDLVESKGRWNPDTHGPMRCFVYQKDSM